MVNFDARNIRRGALCGLVPALADWMLHAAFVLRKSAREDDYNAASEALPLFCTVIPAHLWTFWAAWCLAAQIESGEISQRQPNGHPGRKAVPCLGCDRGATAIEQQQAAGGALVVRADGAGGAGAALGA